MIDVVMIGNSVRTGSRRITNGLLDDLNIKLDVIHI